MTINKNKTPTKKVVKCPICKHVLIAYGDVFFKHCGEAHFVRDHQISINKSNEVKDSE